MMKSPILSKGKIIRKVILPEQKNLFYTPLSPEKKEHEKKIGEKPRGYKSLHNSEYDDLTQLNP